MCFDVFTYIYVYILFWLLFRYKNCTSLLEHTVDGVDMSLQCRGMDDVNSVCVHVRRSPERLDSTFILLFVPGMKGYVGMGYVYEVTDMKTDLALS